MTWTLSSVCRADDVRVRRAEAEADIVRRYAATRFGAKSWG